MTKKFRYSSFLITFFIFLAAFLLTKYRLESELVSHAEKKTGLSISVRSLDYNFYNSELFANNIGFKLHPEDPLDLLFVGKIKTKINFWSLLNSNYKVDRLEFHDLKFLRANESKSSRIESSSLDRLLSPEDYINDLKMTDVEGATGSFILEAKKRQKSLRTEIEELTKAVPNIELINTHQKLISSYKSNLDQEKKERTASAVKDLIYKMGVYDILESRILKLLKKEKQHYKRIENAIRKDVYANLRQFQEYSLEDSKLNENFFKNKYFAIENAVSKLFDLVEKNINSVEFVIHDDTVAIDRSNGFKLTAQPKNSADLFGLNVLYHFIDGTHKLSTFFIKTSLKDIEFLHSKSVKIYFKDGKLRYGLNLERENNQLSYTINEFYHEYELGVKGPARAVFLEDRLNAKNNILLEMQKKDEVLIKSNFVANLKSVLFDDFVSLPKKIESKLNEIVALKFNEEFIKLSDSLHAIENFSLEILRKRKGKLKKTIFDLKSQIILVKKDFNIEVEKLGISSP